MKKITKIKNIVINTLKNNLIFLLGVGLLTYKSLFLNYNLGLEITKELVLYTSLIPLLLMIPAINKNNRKSIIYLNVIYFIITIIIYCNYLYYSYSTNLLSFYQIDNIKYAKEIGSGITCIINIKNILMFWIDNILLLIISICSRKINFKESFNNRGAKIILIFFILLINIYFYNTKIVDLYISKSYNKSLIIQNISVYFYHIEDFRDYISNIFTKGNIDYDKLNKIYEEDIKVKKTSDYNGISANSNVIILQLESLNEFVINKKINGKEITPNLNKFYNENIYCSNMYNQGLGTTADSEFEMENSLYPLENGQVFQKYYNNTWSDIYSILKSNNYYTSFMHPNTSTFWNREAVYNAGYEIDEYDDILAFDDIENAGEFYSDEGFLLSAIDIMNSYDKKFITTLVSVTTHIPFYLDGVSNIDEKVNIDVSNIKNEEFGRYLQSCNFVDYAFGKFLEKLDSTGLSKETILVVYGDHGAGLPYDEDIEALYQENNITYSDFESKTKDIHIPFGIRIPNLNKSFVISKAVSKIDIKPTVLDILGIKDRFSIGESIFTNKDYSFIKGLGYITEHFYCINDKLYSRDNSLEIQTDDNFEKLKLKMENEIYLSDIIIKNNLLTK